MQIFKSNSSDQTKDIANKLAERFRNGGIIALSGRLGAGKTTFAQGFARGLGIEDKIISPTYLIIRQYRIPGQTNFFYHIDLYRLEDINLKETGLSEIFGELSNIVLIEWADKILQDLPDSAEKIKLKKISENRHEIQVTN